MAAMTDFMENKFIDWFFRGQALGIAGASAAAGSGPTALFFGLLTIAPTDSTAGTEVSTVGTNYARQSVASALANWAGTQAAGSTVASSGASGTTSNNAAITFGAPSANWGTIAAWGIYDSVSGGNLLFYTLQTPNKTVNNGDPAPSFPIGAAQVQVDN